MRLFLAVDLPEKVKKQLDEQITSLKKEYPRFRWVMVKNFHLTIHFFGERNDLENIKKKIKDLLWDQDSFYLYSFNLDIFVNHRLVLYLTFHREKKIEKLTQKIKENFDNNYVNQRKFIPHLTLARGPRSSKQQYFALKKKLSKINIDIFFPVKKLILFESNLESGKPVYKKLAVFNLR